VGTLDAYMEAQLDISGENPRFNLCNPHWPLRSVSMARPAMSGGLRDSRRSFAKGAFAQDFEVMQYGTA
jgi:ADP-glucose pyrophosphorylase